MNFSISHLDLGLSGRKSRQIINGDVNGSYNILRKIFLEAFSDGIESCVVQPRRVTSPLVKTKVKAAMPTKAV